MEHEVQLRRRIRGLTLLFIVGLVVSGLTAIPLEGEVDLLARWIGIPDTMTGAAASGLGAWIAAVRQALHETNARFPFLAYGTDWLAFGHIVIAIAFWGALRDPVRNIWLFQFGLIACFLVIPFAFVFGAVRGIPFYWRLIDCSFGVFGAMPMWLCKRYATELTTAVAIKSEIRR